MATSKGIRLMKAAKEFNIGKDTLVQFLRDKKFEVENKPNTVLSEEMYEELMLEYAQDKAAKKKSEKISLQVKSVDEESKKAAPRTKEKVSLKKDEAVKLTVKDKIDLDKPKEEAKEAAATEEKPKAKKVVKKKPTEKVSLKKDEAVKLTVKDKIDLDKQATEEDKEEVVQTPKAKKVHKTDGGEKKEEAEAKIENIKSTKA